MLFYDFWGKCELIMLAITVVAILIGLPMYKKMSAGSDEEQEEA